MNILSKYKNYFTKTEICLWSSSVVLILSSFWIFDRAGYMSLFSSLIGVTSLILCAKGNFWGQILVIIFSLLYGIISYSFSYFGEMITYIFMTLPMAVITLISWYRHPYKGEKNEVKVSRLNKKQCVIMWGLTVSVTFVFYFILKYFNTANLIPSTISIATSFMAVYLTSRRSPMFAVAYAANDIVLIVLWSIASFSDISYISMVVCFWAFLANDIYSFINWRKMEERQSRNL